MEAAAGGRRSGTAGLSEGSSCRGHGSRLISRRMTEPSPGVCSLVDSSSGRAREGNEKARGKQKQMFPLALTGLTQTNRLIFF